MSQEYKDLMDEKFKTVNKSIEDNYRILKKDQKESTQRIFDKLSDMMQSVSDLKGEISDLHNLREEVHGDIESAAERVRKETMWWINIQGIFQKHPKTAIFVVLLVWQTVNLEKLRSVLTPIISGIWMQQ